MLKYLCFYKGKSVVVVADSSFAAQKLAAAALKAKRMYEVKVMLAEKDGVAVVHSTASL